MAEYRVEVRRSAARELDDIDSRFGTRILASIDALTYEPRPRQSRKLTGSQDSYRLRVGPYRILYQVNDRTKEIIVYAIGHRREVYR